MKTYVLGFKHKVLTIDTVNIVGVFTTIEGVITSIKKLKKKIEKKSGFLNNLSIFEYRDEVIVEETDWVDFIKRESDGV